MKIPVIAYSCGGPGEVVLDGVTGYLVKPYDHKLMAEKVMRLIDSKETRQTFGENGRQRIMQNFGLDVHVKAVEGIFDELQSKYSY